MTARPQGHIAVPPVLRDQEKELAKRHPDYDSVILALTEMVMARFTERRHHMHALIILARALLERNKDDDHKVAVRRSHQAYDLAVAIGVPELVFRAGCRLAVALTITGETTLGTEIMSSMRYRFLRDDRDGTRQRYLAAREAEVAAYTTAA